MVLAGIALFAVFSVTIWLFSLDRNEFRAELAMESDAMAVVNYYVPKRIQLQNMPLESDLTLPTLQSPHPLFGALAIGNGPDSLISILVDEISGRNMSLLYIDRNNNEDLTDDGDPAWDDVNATFRTKEVMVEVSYKAGSEVHIVPYPVSFYRYTGRLPETLIAFRNGYRKGHIALLDITYKLALFDDDLNGLFHDTERTAVVIDVNRDGVLDGASDSDEYFKATDYFGIGGKTYRLYNVSPTGEQISLVLADTVVYPKQTLETDVRAPSFRTVDIDGNVIDLEDYQNKVVLLDFWATWCKPWQESLDELKRSYQKYHKRGFEIIGLSLDYDLDSLRTYLDENNITWPQIADGQGWDMALADLFNIEALPRNYLLDRNGVIRYKNLHGRNLEAKVYELLNETAGE